MLTKIVFIVLICTISGAEVADVPETLIVGGEEAKVNEFPWLVRIWAFPTAGEPRFCAATLVEMDLILTTATCVANSSQIIATAGDHSIMEFDHTEQSLTSKQVIIHEDFNATGKLENDVALVQLVAQLESTPAVKTVNLVANDFDINNAINGIAAGWGQTEIPSEGNGELAATLRKVRVPTLNSTVCGALPFVDVDDKTFCTSDVKGGLSGDIGSPLICSNVPTNVCGILSRVVVTDEDPKQIIGVYMKISDYNRWIENNLPPLPTVTTPSTTTTRDPSTTGDATTTPIATTPSGSSNLMAGFSVIIFMLSLLL